MSGFLDYLPLLALTVAVEATVALLGRAAAGPLREVPPGTLLRDLLLLNLLTHPTATWVYGEGSVPWAVLEMTVTAVEAAGYAVVTRIAWPWAVALSIACNGLTASLSFVV